MMTFRNLFIVGVIAVLLAIGVNTGFSVVAYDSVHSGTIRNCEEIEEVKEGLRSTIEEANRFTQSSHIRRTPEKERTERYYNDVLAKFRARSCTSELTKKGTHARGIRKKAPVKHRDKARHLHN